MSRQERRENAVIAIAAAHSLLIGTLIALTGDLAIGPVRLWLAAVAASVFVMAGISAIGFRYVDRMHRQGR
jgi:hypothetical protein